MIKVSASQAYITGGSGQIVIDIKWSIGQDSVFYVCNDKQGSITALLKQNGTVSERYSYDAYGPAIGSVHLK